MNNEYTQESCVCQTQAETCTNVTSQYANVIVPLKLCPYATVEKLATECCGEPLVTSQKSCDCGCEITISQTVCMRVTLKYGTTADVQETNVICKKNPNCCNMCE